MQVRQSLAYICLRPTRNQICMPGTTAKTCSCCNRQDKTYTCHCPQMCRRRMSEEPHLFVANMRITSRRADSDKVLIQRVDRMEVKQSLAYMCLRPKRIRICMLGTTAKTCSCCIPQDTKRTRRYSQMYRQHKSLHAKIRHTCNTYTDRSEISLCTTSAATVRARFAVPTSR